MKATLTENYVLVETDDIDFSMLRLAVENRPHRPHQQAHYTSELTADEAEIILRALIT